MCDSEEGVVVPEVRIADKTVRSLLLERAEMTMEGTLSAAMVFRLGDGWQKKICCEIK